MVTCNPSTWEKSDSQGQLANHTTRIVSYNYRRDPASRNKTEIYGRNLSSTPGFYTHVHWHTCKHATFIYNCWKILTGDLVGPVVLFHVPVRPENTHSSTIPSASDSVVWRPHLVRKPALGHVTKTPSVIGGYISKTWDHVLEYFLEITSSILNI